MAPLARDVREALLDAGYQVVVDAQSEGLTVSEVPAGIRVRWVNSDEFISRTGGSVSYEGRREIRAVVQIAIAAMLAQLGFVVAERADEDDVVVLPDRVADETHRGTP